MKTIQSIKGLDIYLLDQIVKGAFHENDKILDAGCGRGRNMHWFVDNGFRIQGCDIAAESLGIAQENTGLGFSDFRRTPIEKMPYSDQEFDAVICNAVLHFARSASHFMDMVKEIHRVLKPQGILFIRMTSTFGLPQNYVDKGNGRFLLADGSERFLLTKELLEQMKEMGFAQAEPVKSVLVEELRSMTTLVLQKS